jgi:thiol-disulfide isomerase/thioredoxin
LNVIADPANKAIRAHMGSFNMISRRTFLIVAATSATAAFAPAFGASSRAFDESAFTEAQKAGKPILVAIHASWCPTCKAQAPILSDLMADPKFKDLAYFRVDFDSQKDVVRRLGARMQSTLIAFKGDKEQGRSVGDTDRASIAALQGKTL